MNYFRLLSRAPTADPVTRIQRWIDSIGPENADNTTRPAKRARRETDDPVSDDAFAHPYCMPSPSDEDTLGLITNLPPPTTLPQLHCLIKDRADLEMLEKPVHIKELESKDTLPSDVQSLYSEIQAAAKFLKEIIPLDLQSQISDLEGQALPTTSFYETKAGLAETKRMFTIVKKIKFSAAFSTTLERHEVAWNNFVHTPLLELAFEAEQPDDLGDPGKKDEAVTVRVEPVMSAVIASNSIPRVQVEPIYPPAWPVPSSSYSPSNSSWQTDLSAKSPADAAHSEGKKVDYVVVLDLGYAVPFRKWIFHLIAWSSTQGFDTSTHFNQTKYTPIYISPIAVLIEAKSTSSQRDPLLQLSIWVAAWHKRMTYLHAVMRELQSGIEDSTEGSTKDTEGDIESGNANIFSSQLVSVPLIVVTGHEWEVFFACDEGHSITIRGPISLGSTKDIIEIFTLIRSLRAIRKWILKEFYTGLQAWFSCEGKSTV
ncbi:hypothetical protein F5Y12DRAFT_779868 [Xylaria sp. FL1777]|nr:hypothetical protein F5Y12DRAFT_779868 [Xylaria sp. FL1777]